MTQTYARTRILNALKENPGSPAKVRQTVMRWAMEDPKLMIELVAPHLSGIVAYAISRAENAQDEEGASEVAPKASAQGKGDQSFGLELLRHVADDNAAVFGQDSGFLSSKKPQTSQSHIDAINMIAKKIDGNK